MKIKRTVGDCLTEEDVAELRRLIRANYTEKWGPLLVEADRSHNSTITWSHDRGYLASGHMDSETAQLFAEAVNVLPKLLDALEELRKLKGQQ